MAKNTKANTNEETSTNNQTENFVVQTGAAPEPSKQDRKATGLTAIIQGLPVGGWFRFPRKADGKVDGSKRANIVKTAKKLGIGVTVYAENETTDICKRVS